MTVFGSTGIILWSPDLIPFSIINGSIGFIDWTVSKDDVTILPGERFVNDKSWYPLIFDLLNPLWILFNARNLLNYLHKNSYLINLYLQN